jgi:hypothetical protein
MVKEHAEFYELMLPIWRGALKELKWEEKDSKQISFVIKSY